MQRARLRFQGLYSSFDGNKLKWVGPKPLELSFIVMRSPFDFA